MGLERAADLAEELAAEADAAASADRPLYAAARLRLLAWLIDRERFPEPESHCELCGLALCEDRGRPRRFCSYSCRGQAPSLRR